MSKGSDASQHRVTMVATSIARGGSGLAVFSCPSAVVERSLDQTPYAPMPKVVSFRFVTGRIDLIFSLKLLAVSARTSSRAKRQNAADVTCHARAWASAFSWRLLEIVSDIRIISLDSHRLLCCPAALAISIPRAVSAPGGWCASASPFLRAIMSQLLACFNLTPSSCVSFLLRTFKRHFFRGSILKKNSQRHLKFRYVPLSVVYLRRKTCLRAMVAPIDVPSARAHGGDGSQKKT